MGGGVEERLGGQDEGREGNWDWHIKLKKNNCFNKKEIKIFYLVILSCSVN